MQTSRLKKTLSIVGVTLMILLIAGLFYRAFTKERAPEVGAHTVPTEAAAGPDGKPAGTAATSGKRIEVYLDGWSQATLKGVRVTATPEAEGAKGQEVTWTPLSADEIAALAETDPDIVTRVAARLFSTVDDLTCNADGCTSSAGDLSFEQLADPRSIPGLGDSYSDLKMRSGIWNARLPLPENAFSTVLSAESWNNATLTLVEGEETDAGVQADGEEGEAVVAEAENGYLKGRYPLSAGLGSFFVTTPSWNGTEPTNYVRREALESDITPEAVRATLAEPLFAKGLSTPSPLSADLLPSQLTYMTSPSTGCGVGVLCTPGTVETSFEDYQLETVNVCNVETGNKAVLALESSIWSFELENRISLQGAWNGESPQDWGGAGNSVVYTGAAPLIKGEQKVRENVTRLFDGINGKVLLFASAGSMGQFGFDSEEALSANLNPDPSLYFQGKYKTC